MEVTEVDWDLFNKMCTITDCKNCQLLMNKIKETIKNGPNFGEEKEKKTLKEKGL